MNELSAYRRKRQVLPTPDSPMIISLINDRVVDIIVTFIASLFAKRKNKKEESEEEEF